MAKSSIEWLTAFCDAEDARESYSPVRQHARVVLAELERSERDARAFRSQVWGLLVSLYLESPLTAIETRRRCEVQADAALARIAAAAREAEGGDA